MKELRNKILEQFKGLSLIESIELLSNVTLALSLENLDIIKDAESLPHNWDECAELIKADVKANGETLANALGKQALTMIMWIETVKKK